MLLRVERSGERKSEEISGENWGLEGEKSMNDLKHSCKTPGGDHYRNTIFCFFPMNEKVQNLKNLNLEIFLCKQALFKRFNREKHPPRASIKVQIPLFT